MKQFLRRLLLAIIIEGVQVALEEIKNSKPKTKRNVKTLQKPQAELPLPAQTTQ